MQLANHPFYESRQRRSRFMSNIDQLTPQDLFPLCLRILRTNPKERKSDEIDILWRMTQSVKFFQNLLQDEGEATLRECLQKIRLELGVENTIVFEKGTKGDKFYIILQGQVGVYITNGIFEEKTKKNNRKSLVNQMIASGVRPSIDQSNDLRKQMLRKLLEKQCSRDLTKVNELKEGDYFGELALINDKPRLATIVCETDCTFAVVNKSDFKEIILKSQESKIKTQLDALLQCAGFQNFSRKLLQILLFEFVSKSFKFREAVYKQGQVCHQELYLIQKGEFVITEQVTQHLNRRIALLEKGAIFGDQEAFRDQNRRVQSVHCNSEQGSVICIELAVLVKRLQSTNELHLYDELKAICENKEFVRNARHSLISEPGVPKAWAKQKERFSLKTEYDASQASPLDRISALVRTKARLFQRLYNSSSKDKNYQIFDFSVPTLKSPIKPQTSHSSNARGTIERLLNSSKISKKTQGSLILECNNYIQQQRINTHYLE